MAGAHQHAHQILKAQKAGGLRERETFLRLISDISGQKIKVVFLKEKAQLCCTYLPFIVCLILSSTGGGTVIFLCLGF